MPLLKLETTHPIPEDKQQPLLATLSRTVAETIGKPETYVMVTLHPAAIQMSGTPGDAAFVDIRSIGGLSADVNRQLTEKTCAIIQASLGISPERVYLNFTDIPRSNWGWNNTTFG